MAQSTTRSCRVGQLIVALFLDRLPYVSDCQTVTWLLRLSDSHPVVKTILIVTQLSRNQRDLSRSLSLDQHLEIK